MESYIVGLGKCTFFSKRKRRQISVIKSTLKIFFVGGKGLESILASQVGKQQTDIFQEWP